MPWSALSGSTSFQFIAIFYGSSGSVTATASNFSIPGGATTGYSSGSYWYVYPTSASGFIPTGSYTYDIEITNSGNPSFVKFNAYLIPGAGYTINGSAGTHNLGVTNHFP